MTFMKLAVVALAALALAAPAAAVGPWPGTVSRVAGYRVASDGTTTRLHAGKRVARLPGAWRIPAITSTQVPGGLSPDGRLLVLVQGNDAATQLRHRSSFLVVSTRTLVPRPVIVLPGEFGYDAVSADGRTLYVIEHRDTTNLNAYVVRAYDLVRRRLYPEPVVAKGEGTTMRGYPVARVTTASGSWVYTLYWREDGTTFVHALDTVQRRAVCLDLSWTTQQAWGARLTLSADGKHLEVGANGRLIETVATPA